jgi:hypothetical protein
LLTILEGTFAEFGGFLLEFFNGTFIDTTALVDQVAGSGGFSGIDVADNWRWIEMINETRTR